MATVTDSCPRHRECWAPSASRGETRAGQPRATTPYKLALIEMYKRYAARQDRPSRQRLILKDQQLFDSAAGQPETARAQHARAAWHFGIGHSEPGWAGGTLGPAPRLPTTFDCGGSSAPRSPFR